MTTEMISLGACPSCGGPAQFIDGGTIRHVPLVDAALRQSGWVELLFGIREDLQAMLTQKALVDRAARGAAQLRIDDIDAAIRSVVPHHV